jgi:hypothetical protein
MQVFDFDAYLFLVGNQSIDLFNYFQVPELHGLNVYDCLEYKETRSDVYIAGMCNYIPQSTKPYLFINLYRLEGNYKDVTLLMHECFHLALKLYNYNLKCEEQIITFAEQTTNKLICILEKYRTNTEL